MIKAMELVLPNLELVAPVRLTGLRLTDDEFLRFCAEHEDLRVESNNSGEVELMAGTGPETGDRNAEIAFQLRRWTKQNGRGRSFDSSSMFVLPSGARRSPDASWVSHARIATVPADELHHLWRLCPEFVIELRSPTDRLAVLDEKMKEWIANGAMLGWLIDPEEQTVSVYRPGAVVEILRRAAAVEGEGPVAGLTLDLTEVWPA
jgi:Uma2 family endonuclease